MAKYFQLIAHFQVKPGHEEDMRKLLVKASEIYKQDKHTVDWIVSQNKGEPSKFSIVERYTNQEDGLKEHTANPFYKEFGETCKPWLEAPPELIFLSEL